MGTCLRVDPLHKRGRGSHQGGRAWRADDFHAAVAVGRQAQEEGWEAGLRGR